MAEKITQKNQSNRKLHTFFLPNHLHKKLSLHINVLKAFEEGKTSNQKWITNAIKNKIKKTGKQNPHEIPKDRKICIKIEDDLLEEINEKVEFLKKFNRTYSRSKLVVEAILDQLEEEREKASKLLEES